MVVFMSGNQTGVDLQGLMLIQATMIPAGVMTIAVILIVFVTRNGWSEGVQRLWNSIPQWMVFVFLLLNSLVVAGEVAFLIVTQAKQQEIHWSNHIPLLCMLSCSLAFVLLYATCHPSSSESPTMSGRWP